jgi:hypothetical protein
MKNINLKKTSIAVVSLFGITMGYCNNPTFEGTYIPKNKDVSSETATKTTNIKPPKYLSVPDYQKCLGQKDMGTWKAWCLPENQPKGCPNASWKQIKFGFDGLDGCTENAISALSYRIVNKAVPSGSWVGFVMTHNFSKTSETMKDDFINYSLRKKCDLKGDVFSKSYSFLIKDGWCLNAAKSILFSKLHPLDKVTYNNSGFSFSGKAHTNKSSSTS